MWHDLFGDPAMAVISTIFGLLVAALLFTGLYFSGKWIIGLGKDTITDEPGVIIGKAYQPDTQQTSSVPVATGNGVGIGVVTTGNREAWVSLIRVGNRVFRFEDLSVYGLTRAGDKVTVKIKHNPQWDDEIVQVIYAPRKDLTP